MATTSIWSVKGWLGRVVIYAENPEKTENPEFFERQDMTAQQMQGLADVIDYAVQGRKTVQAESRALLRQFVSGVNCQPATARDEMMKTKRIFKKDDGVVAYHGYQFAYILRSTKNRYFMLQQTTSMRKKEWSRLKYGRLHASDMR
jgi:hypothetical protein